MNTTQLAVIADVHGNRWALEAVLADLARRGVREIINLGDNANGPLDPVGTTTRLRELRAVHVRGNGDRMTALGSAGVRGSAAYARERLDEEALRWLRDLPTAAEGDGWVAFHASPHSDEAYVLENLAGGRAVLASPAEVGARLGPTSGSLVLCGHTHIPRLVQLEDGRLVLNPGSVGLPAYEDSEPTPHAMEAGSPHARYALASRTGNTWSVEFVCVPYDREAAAAAARAAGFHAWIQPLLTGFV